MKSTERRSGPYPYYGASGVVDYVDSFIFEGLHLLVAEDGENLRSRNTPVAFLADGQFWVNNHAHVLQANPENDTRYLSYAVEQLDLSGYLTGSTQPKLTKAALDSIPIEHPPLPVQQAIAEVLGALDDKIAANATLAAAADEAVSTSYLASICRDAVERPLMDELIIEFGEPFGGASFGEPGDGRPLVRIRDLKTFQPQVWTTELRTREVVVAPGDVLVGMDAEFRSTAWLGVSGVLNQRVLRASHSTRGRALVRELLKRPLREAEAEKSATTVIHLNKSDLVRKTVTLPVADALDAFESFAEPLYEARLALAAENRTLAATRDALLPQLMSGKLRVRDAETIASAAGA